MIVPSTHAQITETKKFERIDQDLSFGIIIFAVVSGLFFYVLTILDLIKEVMP